MVESDMDYEDYFGKNGDGQSFYDEIDIMEFQYYPETEQFTYPCPCGDLFIITLDDIKNSETIARCVSCSLVVMVVYDQSDISKYENMKLNKKAECEII